MCGIQRLGEHRAQFGPGQPVKQLARNLAARQDALNGLDVRLFAKLAEQARGKAPREVGDDDALPAAQQRGSERGERCRPGIRGATENAGHARGLRERHWIPQVRRLDPAVSVGVEFCDALLPGEDFRR